METRLRPLVVSTRVRPSERAMIRAVAEADGLTVSEALHRMLMPAVRQRLEELVREPVGAGR